MRELLAMDLSIGVADGNSSLHNKNDHDYG